MNQQKTNRPGPEAARVKSDNNWKDTIKDALKKKCPENGWPEAEKEKKKGSGS